MKKTIVTLVALLLTLSVAVFPVLADEGSTAITTVGYSSSRVVTKDLSSVPCIHFCMDEDYKDSAEFKISTADDLTYFAEMVNDYWKTFENVTVYLENDIDLGGETWTPIGYNESKTISNKFAGTFDGLGHMVDNFVVSSDTTAELLTLGFFGCVVEGATIKNLVIGPRASVTYTGTSTDVRCGGIVGSFKSKKSVLDNCYNMATVTSSTLYAGGVLGFSEGNESEIKNCTNTGAVQSNQRAGGILGYLGNKAITIDNCRNTGTVTANATGVKCYVGGIVGMLNNKDAVCAVTNCINNGAITGSVTLPENATAEVIAESVVAVGPIAGMTRGDSTYSGNLNYGTVTPASNLVTTTSVFGAYYNTTEDTAKTKLGQGNQNLAGTADATLSTDVETITPSFNTAVCPNAPAENDPSDDNDDGSDGTTTAPSTTKKPDTTTAPSNTTTEAPTEEKKGCGSVAGGIAIMLMTVGAAVVVAKKKEL